MENKKYIEKWLKNSLSEEEKRVFETTQEFDSLEKLDKALLKFKAPEYNVESELARLKGKKQAKAKEVKVSWLQPLLKIAAVITIVFMGYYLLFLNSATTVESTFAQKIELTLPDNSEVTLNASSSISYVENQWKKQRAVELIGEAFFKVAKGSQFDVKTSSGVITVMGTQFNVKVRNNYFEVVCYEGLVAVKSANEEVKLPPNHIFRIVNNNVLNDSIFVDTTPSWLANESSFMSIPFEQVVKEFERQYSVTITTNNVDLSQLFTGRFTHNDISLALKSISFPLKLHYELEEGQHILLTGDIE